MIYIDLAQGYRKVNYAIIQKSYLRDKMSINILEDTYIIIRPCLPPLATPVAPVVHNSQQLFRVELKEVLSLK